ncbi:VanZ family protein [Sporolactobacillus vineae]|nr:VanZ family protein [Sporolactobacillus vineae]
MIFSFFSDYYLFLNAFHHSGESLTALCLGVFVNLTIFNLIFYFLTTRIRIDKLFNGIVFLLYQFYLWIVYVLTISFGLSSYWFAFTHNQFTGTFHFPWEAVNLLPLRTIIDTFASPVSLATYIQIFGNLFMFSPLCFFLLFFGRSLKRSLISIFFCSISIELIQLLYNIISSKYVYGAERATDFDDILLNSFGALFGALIYKIFLSLSRIDKNVV